MFTIARRKIRYEEEFSFNKNDRLTVYLEGRDPFENSQSDEAEAYTSYNWATLTKNIHDR